MALVGRLHPLIVHFPIALVIVAAAAEGGAIVTGDARWRAVAIMNIRAGAAFAVAAVAAGWLLASGVEIAPPLEWHRWLGVVAALSAVVAAAATIHGVRWPPHRFWIYRAGLFSAAAFVAATGHSGGLLVWGAEFMRF